MRQLERKLTVNGAKSIRGEFYKRDIKFNEDTICENLYNVDWRMVKALMKKMDLEYDANYVEIGYEDSGRTTAEHNYSSIQGILYEALEILTNAGEM